MKTEIQAIVLAGGAGVRLYPLVDQHAPKATLPIANKPMIHYTLTYLEKNGFKEAIVVVSGNQQREINQALKEYRGKISIQLKSVDSKDTNENMDSAEALRAIYDLIYTDFLVISSDLITDVPLLNVLDIHRQHNSSLTLLLKDESNISSSDSDEIDYFALTNYERGAIQQFVDSEQPISAMQRRKKLALKPPRVIMDQVLDSEDKTLSVPRAFMRRWPNFTLTKGLKDSHLYICAKWIADLLLQKPEMESLKHDVIPFLVDSQNLPSDKLDETLSKIVPPFLQTEAYKMSTTDTRPDDLIRVFAYVVPPHEDKPTTSTSQKSLKPGLFCKRCNTISSLLYINREIARKNNVSFFEELAQYKNTPASAAGDSYLLGPDCVVGEGLVFTGLNKKLRPTIKKSNIGKQCKIGQASKIENSVIMDNVTIGDNCVVSNSVVASGVTIESGTKLFGCQVGPNFEVEVNEYKDEQLTGGDMEL
ncbi:hypothetical protein FDP41_006604 [Naegleria fowleri]|uniref:Translation initiation factor eIF2B subunit gamma n=1 Tax=Naegleria fowleri TaxID=5763 RepID=A0A6A5BIA4_NAEFO|nr:uncharacterized protein FDP41_006604 [Naegleria fowleri]KAF0974572.1 hypothetical protein FDP41_006604 [Naegleria fowleri]CAG4715982.1 unnamed protein product [Naegleria fowleri]